MLILRKTNFPKIQENMYFTLLSKQPFANDLTDFPKCTHRNKNQRQQAPNQNCPNLSTKKVALKFIQPI